MPFKLILAIAKQDNEALHSPSHPDGILQKPRKQLPLGKGKQKIQIRDCSKKSDVEALKRKFPKKSDKKDFFCGKAKKQGFHSSSECM